MKVKFTNLLTRKRLLFGLFLIGVLLLSYLAFFSNIYLKLFFYEKIWVHRVNSIEKLSEVSNHFSGVEVDVVFLDSLQVFDVSHPPTPSINLNLKEYLQSCSNSQMHFWIDFKNLSITNFNTALNRLNEILDQLSIERSRVIVESPRVWQLSRYQDAGYSTSYYLNWPGLYKMDEGLLEESIETIKSYTDNDEKIFISSNYHDYTIMKHYFPKQQKLLWLTGNEKEYSIAIMERLYLYKILMDESVKVLLVQYDSKSGNR